MKKIIGYIIIGFVLIGLCIACAMIFSLRDLINVVVGVGAALLVCLLVNFAINLIIDN